MVGIIKTPPPRCPYPNLQNLCMFYPVFTSQSFSASGSSPMSRLFTSGGQNIGALASVLPMNIQG